MLPEHSSTPSLASETLTCPNCRTAITYYDVTGSSFYGCPACRTFFEYEGEGPPRILTQFNAANTTPRLAIGQTGAIEGEGVRVVGYMRRIEKESTEEWDEYMLLLAAGTYWQLAEYNGHWMSIQPAGESFTDSYISKRQAYVDDDDRRYNLYHRYQPRTLYAVGEFDWNILDDDALTASEYIDPPMMLICEKLAKKEDWYRATYKTRQEIADAFGLPAADLPTPYGTGAIQPAFNDSLWKPLYRFTLAMVGLLFLTQLLLIGLNTERTLLNQSFTSQSDMKPDSATGATPQPYSRATLVTPSFNVTGPTALKINLHIPLANQWMELSMNLINEQTGRTYEFTKVMEYYYGREGGENWTEGRTTEEAVLSRMPTGRYHLNVYPSTDTHAPLTVQVKVTQNTSLLSNFLLVAVALLAFPVYLYFRGKHIEQKRWAGSDYGPENEDD